MGRLSDWRDEFGDFDWTGQADEMRRATRPAVRAVRRNARPAVSALVSAARSTRDRFDDIDLPTADDLQELVPADRLQGTISRGSRRLNFQRGRRRATLLRRVAVIVVAVAVVAAVAEVLRRRCTTDTPDPGEAALDHSLNGEAPASADAVERAA